MNECKDPPTPVTDAIARLLAWNAPSSLVAARDDYVALLRDRGAAALDRDGGPVHLTASCFICNPTLTHGARHNCTSLGMIFSRII